MAQGLTPEDLTDALNKAFPPFKAEVALARIEEQLKAVIATVDRMSKTIDKMDEELTELRDVKNRGLGWLAGVAVAGGAVGAFLKTIIAAMVGAG